MLEAVREHGSDDPNGLLAYVQNQCDKFADGAPPEDDQALLIMQYL